MSAAEITKLVVLIGIANYKKDLEIYFGPSITSHEPTYGATDWDPSNLLGQCILQY